MLVIRKPNGPGFEEPCGYDHPNVGRRFYFDDAGFKLPYQYKVLWKGWSTDEVFKSYFKGNLFPSAEEGEKVMVYIVIHEKPKSTMKGKEEGAFVLWCPTSSPLIWIDPPRKVTS